MSAPFLWWFALLATTAASAAGGPSAACTSSRPCQPDPAFAVAVALVAIAGVGFWWVPRLGLLAGIGYGVLTVFVSPGWVGRYAGLALVVVAVAGLAGLRTRRDRQAAVAADCGPEVPASQRLLLAADRRLDRRRFGWPAVVAPAVGVLGLAMVALCLDGYQIDTAQERTHLARAQTATATAVTGLDGEGRQVFLLGGADAGRRVSIEVGAEVVRGASTDVLLDPRDPSWIRLAAEPGDYTFWLGWAVVWGMATAWSAGQLIGRRHAARLTAPARLYDIRVTAWRAELLLADGGSSVATVRLGSLTPTGERRLVPAAVVAGHASDGSWVGIIVEGTRLPVVGPVRATQRWGYLPAWTDPVTGGLTEAVDRARRPAGTVARILLALAGGALLVGGVLQAGPAWSAYVGDGVPGQVTVISEDCSGRGGCHYRGDFRSTDGRYAFPDVALSGASGPVGSSVSVLYEGHGERPDAVYGPGWHALAECGFLVALGLFALGGPAAHLAAYVAARRNPPQGRHVDRSG